MLSPVGGETFGVVVVAAWVGAMGPGRLLLLLLLRGLEQ